MLEFKKLKTYILIYQIIKLTNATISNILDKLVKPTSEVLNFLYRKIYVQKLKNIKYTFKKKKIFIKL